MEMVAQQLHQQLILFLVASGGDDGGMVLHRAAGLTHLHRRATLAAFQLKLFSDVVSRITAAAAESAGGAVCCCWRRQWRGWAISYFGAGAVAQIRTPWLLVSETMTLISPRPRLMKAEGMSCGTGQCCQASTRMKVLCQCFMIPNPDLLTGNTGGHHLKSRQPQSCGMAGESICFFASVDDSVECHSS